MLLIPCPWCGSRPENEFHYGGQAHIVRPADPGLVDDTTWTNYLYFRDNERGRHRERWQHQYGCGRFFNLERDTVTDQIIASYRPNEAPPS
jgi:sarcosine oxidase subunit delta